MPSFIHLHTSAKDSLLFNNDSKADKENLQASRMYLSYTVIFLSIIGILIKKLNFYFSMSEICTALSEGRFVVVFLCLVVQFSYKGIKKPDPMGVSKELQLWMLTRSLGMTIFFIFFPLSTSYLKLGTAVVILSINPILTNILSSIILKEKFIPKYLVSCIIAFFGLLLTTLSSHHSSSESDAKLTFNDLLFGCFIGLISALSFALINISGKVLIKSFSSEDLNYITSTWGIIINFIIMIFFDRKAFSVFFDGTYLFFIILIGITTWVTYHLGNIAIKLADISKTSYILYLQIPIVALYEIIILGISYSFLEVLGILIIVSSLLITSVFYK